MKKKRMIRVLLIVLTLILLPLPIGFIWQAIASHNEAKKYPAPGQMVDAGGYKVHVLASGKGSPTTLLMGGVPEWSIHWQPVTDLLSQYTRVISYDRSGYGWSETAKEKPSANQIVKELHNLLSSSKETGPYILVVHSFWGPAALLFQKTYPDEVAGLIMVEAWSPELYKPVPEVISKSLPLAHTLQVLGPLGQLRLVGETGIVPLDSMLKTNLLPENLRGIFKSSYYSGKMWKAMAREYESISTSSIETEGLGKAGSLGNLPLAVIQAEKRETDDFPSQEVWDDVQQQLFSLSSKGVFVRAQNSGHMVQLEDPNLVVQTILQVIKETGLSISVK